MSHDAHSHNYCYPGTVPMPMHIPSTPYESEPAQSIHHEQDSGREYDLSHKPDQCEDLHGVMVLVFPYCRIQLEVVCNDRTVQDQRKRDEGDTAFLEEKEPFHP